MFRFTIRDVLWLTVVVALAVGWVVDNRLNSRYRVGPPEWHEMLRTVVDDLRNRSDIDIRNCKSVCVGVMTESGAMHWHSVDYKESE